MKDSLFLNKKNISVENLFIYFQTIFYIIQLFNWLTAVLQSLHKELKRLFFAMIFDDSCQFND